MDQHGLISAAEGGCVIRVDPRETVEKSDALHLRRARTLEYHRGPHPFGRWIASCRRPVAQAPDRADGNCSKSCCAARLFTDAA
jgi:hypothetical protein